LVKKYWTVEEQISDSYKKSLEGFRKRFEGMKERFGRYLGW
jgi:hypothetical protein